MSSRIAVVGMACRYPDAASPGELWENALAGRRAFRRLPDARMRLEDYWDADPAAPDRFYASTAAVIEGYEFDRVAYKVAGSTYRSTDLAHWLALDMSASALTDAGFPMAEGLPRERTGVVVGNTLTGEFSRANQLRLRWPYVRRMVAAALKDQDWDDERLRVFLDDFETTFKRPFPPVDEDTLAGALSNTIAGRICNHFDLKGGGYTVDGACSSSLLSVATACKALVDGDLDVAIAGGVDLSIDPFEVIGFAKAGALAEGEMRVYDRASNGFWPGEGCGMVVLMRDEDARRAGHRVYATIVGWGISSDGRGAITRPDTGGYRLALRRAYERAGFGIETVPLFEGHGTGTRVGDGTELRALSEARLAADPLAAPAAVGSVKGIVGHTKAAAGAAGLIKAAMAVHHQVLPPAVGCVDPHELLTDASSTLRVLHRAEPWPAGQPVRAGVTAMGFGGINTHIVLENPEPRRRVSLDRRTRQLASSMQDVELLLFDAASVPELRDRLDSVADFLPGLAYAQVSDLAATLHQELRGRPYRAAAVVSSPDDAVRLLRQLCGVLDVGETSLFSATGRGFLGHSNAPGRIAYLFPGQGSGRGTSGGALRRRFAEAEDAYRRAALPAGVDPVATEVAQPRVVTGTIAGLRVLTALGLAANVAVGHSLGELSALHWAGALTEESLMRIAAVRGRSMAAHGTEGTMASIAGSPELIHRLVAELPVVVAAHNGPVQTVIAGPPEAVRLACRAAEAAGFATTPVPVSHAFHSPLVAAAADVFAASLGGERFDAVQRRVVSTVTGDVLPADVDVAALLRRQITSPVLFAQAVCLAAKDVDLFVEVGPGHVLTGLAAAATDVPAVALDTDDESLTGLLRAVGAAYAIGATDVDAALFHGRLIRPLRVGTRFRFFANPCEQAPLAAVPEPNRTDAGTPPQPRYADAGDDRELSTVDMLRRLAALRAELPLEAVRPGSRLLDDLHLSSITVGQLMNQAAQRMGLPAAKTPTNPASATVGELADALDALAATAHDTDLSEAPPVLGVAGWARVWSVDLDETPLPAPVAWPGDGDGDGDWRVYAEPGDPLAEPLRAALSSAGIGRGVLVCLPDRCTEAQLCHALSGAHTIVAGPRDGGRFVLVQRGRGAAGIAKTLRLEAPETRVTVVHVPASADREWVGRVVAEARATARFTEVHLDADSGRRVPTLRALPIRPARTAPALNPDDVVLATGGGKGITAECALAMAVDSGARLALIGRSDPLQDKELAANLARMADAGVTVRYARADVTDPTQVRRAMRELTQVLGPVSAVLHGAGINVPARLSTVDSELIRTTFAPKLDGLAAVLDAVDPRQLRLLVTFGSIIGRAGLRGEAHYATANEWLAELTADVGRRYPRCRTVCVEWSVWSGVGMGERLAVVEALTREGVVAIPVDEAIALLRRVLVDPDAPANVVVSGRTGAIDTVRYEQPPLPLLRFTERPLVRYHGVELVTEVELNAGTDPYLADHRLDGNLLLPAVLGLEAMAQVAAAVTGREDTPVIERVEFARSVLVPPDGTTRIRIAALITGDGTVDVAIYSDETAFTTIHFQARLSYPKHGIPDGPPVPVGATAPAVSLAPATDLYGGILFQGNRFQRLRRYHRVAARYVDADVATVEPVPWFAGYLPDTLLLGDPGTRDALMHGNQVCVPDATLLPTGVDRVYPAGRRLAGTGELRYCATERERDGDLYVYDVALRTAAGELVERWEGLRLRAVRRTDPHGPWVPVLVGPYLERAVEELLGVRMAVAAEREPVDTTGGPGGHVQRRRQRTAVAAARALGRTVDVRYRPDGRPEIDGDVSISAAHGAGLILCVAGTDPIACDVEPVVARPLTEWRGLLGPHHDLAEMVATSGGESIQISATRVWAGIECLQKAGRSPRDPLVLHTTDQTGWAVFASGDLRIASLSTTVRSITEPVVFAVLAQERR